MTGEMETWPPSSPRGLSISYLSSVLPIFFIPANMSDGAFVRFKCLFGEVVSYTFLYFCFFTFISFNLSYLFLRIFPSLIFFFLDLY